MRRNDDDAPVMLGYESSRNISFHGEEETGYTWGEWREMTTAERDEVIANVADELVDVYVQNEEY
jgi:hypothetical protein